MRLGIDAREIQDGVVTGIGRPLINFIEFCQRHDPNSKLTLYSERPLPIELDANIHQTVLPAAPTFLWDQYRLPAAIHDRPLELFYSPYYKVPLMTRVPVINQVLDLMYLVYPPYRQALGIHRRLYYAVFGRLYCRKALSVITDSYHAKSDIIRLWAVPQKKIAVIPLGLGERYVPVTDKQALARVQRDLDLPDHFILYLGNFKPHKNVVSLVRAFDRIAHRFPSHRLVLAGPLDRHGHNLRNFVATLGCCEKIQFTDTITEADTPEALLSMAELFVFPSLYEGFGLPPLEAMACGTPVIASNRTSVPEVVGDAGLLVDPLDLGELAQAMEALLSNQDRRTEYAYRGLLHAQAFSKQRTAGMLYQHIMSVAEVLR